MCHSSSSAPPHAHPLLSTLPHLRLRLVAAALEEAAQCRVAVHLLSDELPLVVVQQPQLVDALPLLLGRLAVMWGRTAGRWSGWQVTQQLGRSAPTLFCTRTRLQLAALEGFSKGIQP